MKQSSDSPLPKEHTMSRRTFTRQASAIIGGSLGMKPVKTFASQMSKESHKNILLLIADDHGLNDSGCYGNPVIKTPNIDRLARSGVRFTNAFATVASCSPSRSVILTGLHNHTNGMYGLMHNYHKQSSLPWVRSLPAILNEYGYRTGIVGKFHVQPRENVYPFQKIYTEGLQGNRDVKAMADSVRRFFDSNPAAPACCVVGFSDPHREWVKNNKKNFAGVRKIKYDPGQVIVPPFLPDQPEVRWEISEYYQSVSRLDQGIGFILDYLEQSGLSENTIVMYISDNGIPFTGAKTNLYDAGIHLPMIVSAPHVSRRGMVNHAMLSFLDIVPTLLEWAGATAPYKLPGRSILPILEEEHPEGWDIIYASHVFHEITMYYPMRAVRTREYKYILNLAHQLEYPTARDMYQSDTWQGILKRKDTMMGKRKVHDYLHRTREELYDIQVDPDEIRNLAPDPAYGAVLADLRFRMKKFQEETKDPWHIKYKHE